MRLAHLVKVFSHMFNFLSGGSMANLANGEVTITSGDSDFLLLFKMIVEHHPAFSYERKPDCTICGNALKVLFYGAWTCCDAWGCIDGFLADYSFPLQQALIASDMRGYAEESSLSYLMHLRKLPGETIITYRHPLETYDINSVWDAFRLFIPFLPKVGVPICVCSLENFTVTSKRKKMTADHGKCLHYNISFDWDMIPFKFSFYITPDGDVVGTKYWNDEIDEEEDVDFIVSENVYIYGLILGYLERTNWM
jgi:hypothetical protein